MNYGLTGPLRFAAISPPFHHTIHGQANQGHGAIGAYLSSCQ